MGQDVFVDVGLTWRVTPQVSEGRASRTTVRASVATPWWEAIVENLLRERVVTNNISVSCPIIKKSWCEGLRTRLIPHHCVISYSSIIIAKSL